MSEIYDAPESPRMTRAVQWLLALNIGVYFLQLTLFGQDAVYSALALDPARFPGDWWTVARYVFVHAWLGHLGFNMFTLWMFGPRLEQEWGTRTFVQFYLWCGLGGAIAHLLFAQHSAVIGASGAISGVLVAYALRWPDEEVYLFGVIPMRSRWLVVALLAMNIIFALSPSARIDWTAHVGGMAFGWIFLKLYSVGGINRVRGWVSAVPDDSEDMPGAVPRNRWPRRDRAAGVDEVVEGSNASVLRQSK